MFKRKKFAVAGSLFALALLCGVCGLAACGEEAHVHTPVTDAAVAATCTSEGKTEGSHCSECGEVIVAQEPIAKLEHSYSAGWVVEKAATCTEEGVESNLCDMCHQGQTRAIEKLAHTYGDWYPVTPASCTAAGVQRRNCIVCNPEGDDGKAYETSPIEKLSHTPKTVEKQEANCLTAGREAGEVCAVCGETLSGLQVIPALGHSMGEPQKLSDSTCTTHGIEKSVCTRTGCEHSVETELPLKQHNRVAIGVASEPTCTAPGITAGEWCSECEEVFEAQQTLPARGHDMQSPAHYEKGDGKYWHRATCSRCDEFEEEECTFTVEVTPATCTAAAHHVHTCDTCAFEYEHDDGVPLGHNFGDWHFDVEAYDASLRDEDGTASVVRRHRRVCSNPGHTADPDFPEVEECGKIVDGESVAATCMTAGYTNYKCGTCEDAYTGEKTDALGHRWEKNADGSIKYTTELYFGQYIHYMTCTREGCTHPKSTYYACRYETARWEAADCEHGKTLVYTCTDCKQEHRIEQGEALGHSYGAWTHDDGTSGTGSRHYRVCGRAGCEHRDEADCTMLSSDKVPTCQRPGREIQVCRDCKYTEEGEEIAKLQHDVTGQPYVKERSAKRHYQACKRCGERVYESCPYELSVNPATCTSDETTTYFCPACEDRYTTVTAVSPGHSVSLYTASDKFSHKGVCDHCGEDVSVPHDFSDSNICAVCGTDGLSYSFVSGSGNTRAMVVRSVKGGIINKLNMSRIVIPEEVDIDGSGLVPVVAVASNAFYQNNVLTEVVLPKNLEKIDYYAFGDCVNLAKVSIAGHGVGEAGVGDCALNRIEDGAFRGCTSLTNAILPATLQYIGREAFRGCKKLNEINIPELVTEIQDHAFTDTAYFNDNGNWHNGVLYIGPHLIRARTTLAGSYIVEDTAVSISAEAFLNCTQLTHITLPASLKAVDKDAFLGCTALDTVVFRGTFAEYLGIRFDNDAASPMHFASTLTIAGAVGAPEIPEGTTVIPAGAFKGSQIESIVIPASVTSIGAQAFYGCTMLGSITFEAGSGLLTVGADIVTGTKFYSAAENWTKGALYLRDGNGKAVVLAAVDAQNTDAYVPYAGENAAGEFRQVEVEEGTRVIAPRVFAGFGALRYVSVAPTVVYIGEGAFAGCTELDRVNFRGTGLSWFCYAANIGRVYTDADLYGGAENDNIAAQKKAADMFALYTLQWKRGRYGSI